MPDAAGVVLLAQLELPQRATAAELHHAVGLAAVSDAPDGPVVRLCRLLDAEGLLDATELVAPDAPARAAALLAFREAAPEAVNRRVGIARRTVDDRIEKTAADMIVPFSRFGESLAVFREAFESRGLDYAIWGHISDANVHPNVIPPQPRMSGAAGRRYSSAAVRSSNSALPAGRTRCRAHRTKQALLRELHGDAGIAEMRAIKRVLDPAGKLAPGLLFPLDRSARGGPGMNNGFLAPLAHHRGGAGGHRLDPAGRAGRFARGAGGRGPGARVRERHRAAGAGALDAAPSPS